MLYHYPLSILTTTLVLARVRAFLPQIAESNKKLSEEATPVTIETVDESKPYIEMVCAPFLSPRTPDASVTPCEDGLLSTTAVP